MRAVKALLAASLFGSVRAILEAPVYTFDPTDNARTGSDVPTISPENARLFFAHRLQLSQYHDLGDADEATVDVLNRYGGVQAPMFAEEDKTPKRLLVIVEGLENTDGKERTSL